MTIQDDIARGVNTALKRKLKRESKQLSKAQIKKQKDDAVYVKKRRRAEDILMAKELGITLQELLND